jgi:hypothetical protein
LCCRLTRRQHNDMADAFQNIDLEQINKDVEKKVKGILDNLDLESINKRVKEKLSTIEALKTDDAFSDDRSYINALPEKYKEKTLRYIDVFRDHPEIVQEYIKTIKEWGTEKDAKNAGSTAELLYPSKLLTKVMKNPEYEKDAKRFFMIMNPLQGEKVYDLSLREDELGRLKQKEWQDKTSTKILGGVTDAFQGTVKELTKTVARLVDWGLDTKSLAYIESNWPEAKKSESGIRKLTEDLTEFGIDIWLGGKIVQTSSIAKKLGFWALPVKYGLGRSVTSDPEQATLAENFGLVTREDTSNMTNKEKAVHDFKWKLAHGGEGTALVGGLTVAFRGALGTLGWTAKNVLGPPLKIAGDYVVNPLAKVAASRMTGIPQLVQGIRNAGGFITKPIPPLEQWQFFSIGAGPLKERIMGLADKFILTPLRTRGPLTREAKALMRKGEDDVRAYRKNVDLDLKRIDSSIYKMLKTGFASRLFTQSSAVA